MTYGAPDGRDAAMKPCWLLYQSSSLCTHTHLQPRCQACNSLVVSTLAMGLNKPTGLPGNCPQLRLTNLPTAPKSKPYGPIKAQGLLSVCAESTAWSKTNQAAASTDCVPTLSRAVGQVAHVKNGNIAATDLPMGWPALGGRSPNLPWVLHCCMYRSDTSPCLPGGKSA
jgi:hypothetical protein